LINFIDINPSITIPVSVFQETEYLLKEFKDLKVSRTTAHNFMRSEYNLSF
ncbi:hypothetical protein F4703DRAFT_1736100, partial [Phycomyces blakesleeanus]